jgi:hypothetical protein
MQSERLASFELCILGCMSNGVTTFSISAVLGMQRRNWLTTRRGCFFGIPHSQRLDIQTGVAEFLLTPCTPSLYPNPGHQEFGGVFN